MQIKEHYILQIKPQCQICRMQLHSAVRMLGFRAATRVGAFLCLSITKSSNRNPNRKDILVSLKNQRRVIYINLRGSGSRWRSRCITSGDHISHFLRQATVTGSEFISRITTSCCTRVAYTSYKKTPTSKI